MVSSSHETLHRIFQEDPGLFVRAVKGVGVTFADPVAAVPFPTDLTENRPVERRVDTLLRLETGDGARFLLAVESQGKPDSDKPASWASRHVDIGPVQWPSLTVRPLVLGPDSLPVINSPDEAARDIPLTVLSAAVHRRAPDAGAILKALATALKDLSADDESTASKFIELTEQGLGVTPAANLWRQIMAADLSFFQSQTAQNLRAEGRAVGRAEAMLLLLGDRGVEVPEEARERILGCQDLDVLGVWFRRAVTAVSVAEVFGASDDG
ncbi:hypothetical protein ACFW6Q_12945 [Streptomyces sp. NPDC058737]|uniref:hypothetical protein n=1 Tax=Streptomyces sp. NPDC058737 TaxID=3346617 RepID=UPI0036C2A42E